MIPNEIKDNPHATNDHSALFVNKNSYGFDCNPGGRGALRISVRINKLSDKPIKVISQAFNRTTFEGREGKAITLINLVPDQVTIWVIINETGVAFSGLTKLVVFLPDKSKDALLLEPLTNNTGSG